MRFALPSLEKEVQEGSWVPIFAKEGASYSTACREVVPCDRWLYSGVRMALVRCLGWRAWSKGSGRRWKFLRQDSQVLPFREEYQRMELSILKAGGAHLAFAQESFR